MRTALIASGVLTLLSAGAAAAQTPPACPTEDWALAVGVSEVNALSWRSKALDEIVSRSPGCSTFLPARARARLNASHQLSGQEEMDAIKAARDDLDAFTKFAAQHPGLDARYRQEAGLQRRRAALRTLYLADIPEATEGAAPDATGAAYQLAIARNLHKAWRASSTADAYKPFRTMLVAYNKAAHTAGLGDDGKGAIYEAACLVKREEQMQAQSAEAGPLPYLWEWLKPKDMATCPTPSSKELSAPRR